jgi:hypothetical protein
MANGSLHGSRVIDADRGKCEPVRANSYNWAFRPELITKMSVVIDAAAREDDSIDAPVGEQIEDHALAGRDTVCVANYGDESFFECRIRDGPREDVEVGVEYVGDDEPDHPRGALPQSHG